MLIPYYSKDGIVIYCGDLRDILPLLGRFDAMVTDPPYASTPLKWDKWPDGWPSVAARVTDSLWCFGTFRMFWDKRDEFNDWKIAQDIVWEKQNGTSPVKNRFRGVHELVVQFYRGVWGEIFANPIYRFDAKARTVTRKQQIPHWGNIESSVYKSEDGGPRLERSVIHCRNCHRKGVFPTQKPEDLVEKFVRYSVPPSGVVVDPMMGSGSTLCVARKLGISAVGIDILEENCRLTVQQLENR
jgi:site-specific DNA-methyltransferase (adenine-specific)